MDLSPTTKNTEFGHINPENNLHIFNTLTGRRNHFICIQEEFSSSAEWMFNPEIKLKILKVSSPFFPSFRIILKLSTEKKRAAN